ncbi:transmembrane 4 L6 family member 5-like isoform X1 [Emydura macquarii macquarii]|uniref:transmembrane 4 L6 family member 5-like isoform X1 n=1 Tax=Emydura macquarii macquarii TaxID=1129001 RepID=UPI00352B9A02
MCTGKCSRVVGIGLWPLALICIVCNLLLFFPNWDTQYLRDKGSTLTPEVLYLGGLVGGGAMNLIPAIYIQATGRKGCCGNRCGMFLSIFFALVGVAGAVYAVSISTLGLVHGPLCQLQHPNSSFTQWLQPFRSTDYDLSKPRTEQMRSQPIPRSRITPAHPPGPLAARQDQEPRCLGSCCLGSQRQGMTPQIHTLEPVWPLVVPDCVTRQAPCTCVCHCFTSCL